MNWRGYVFNVYAIIIGYVVLAVAISYIFALFCKNLGAGDKEIRIWIPVIGEGPIFRTKAPLSDYEEILLLQKFE